MGKYDKENTAASGWKGKGNLIGCLAAVVALVVVLTVFLSGKAPEAQEQTGSIQSSASEEASSDPAQTRLPGLELTVEQEGQMMVITTSYCVLKYPFAFSDVIRVTAENQAALLFCAWLNNTEYPMFSIVFDGNGGIPVGTLKLDDGTVVSVTAQLFEADEAMEPDMLKSFYAVQETINDIIQSLAENEHFTPAA